MTVEKKPLFVLTGDMLKTVSVVVSIVMTLFGVIKFAITKVDEYDNYGHRIAILEAKQSKGDSLADASREAKFQLDSNKTDIDEMKRKLDGISNDIVSLRVSSEHLRTLLERRK